MGQPVTIIYPDGTLSDEVLYSVPGVGTRVGPFVVARIEEKAPDDEVDTETRVYLQKAQE